MWGLNLREFLKRYSEYERTSGGVTKNPGFSHQRSTLLTPGFERITVNLVHPYSSH